jgi:hypothetical protein
VAKSGLQRQLDKANAAFAMVVEEHHVAIGENARRHTEAVDMYKNINAELMHLSSEVAEARRLLNPRGSDGLPELHFKGAVLGEVVSLLDAAAAVARAPREAEDFLARGALLEAAKAIDAALRRAETADLAGLEPLTPARRRLAAAREACAAAAAHEAARHLYGIEGDARGAPQWLSDAGAAQEALLAALDAARALGPPWVARAGEELAKGLTTNMHRVVAARVAAARAVGGDGRSAAALASLVAGVLEALRRVLRLHLCACNQIDAALLAAPPGTQAVGGAGLSMRGVWEAAQAEVAALLAAQLRGAEQARPPPGARAPGGEGAVRVLL